MNVEAPTGNEAANVKCNQSYSINTVSTASWGQSKVCEMFQNNLSLTDPEREKFCKFLMDHHTVFSLEDGEHGETNLVQLEKTGVTAERIYCNSMKDQIRVHLQQVTRCPPAFPAGCYWHGDRRKGPGHPPKWIDDFVNDDAVSMDSMEDHNEDPPGEEEHLINWRTTETDLVRRTTMINWRYTVKAKPMRSNLTWRTNLLRRSNLTKDRINLKINKTNLGEQSS